MFKLDEHTTFYLIPKETLEDLLVAIQDLRDMRDELGDKGKTDPLNGYVPEGRAMEILDRGSTWFWQKRKSGELNGRKAGGRWYYLLIDIQKFISNGTEK